MIKLRFAFEPFPPDNMALLFAIDMFSREKARSLLCAPVFKRHQEVLFEVGMSVFVLTSFYLSSLYLFKWKHSDVVTDP